MLRYEKGDPIPSDIVARICEITGCRPDWLILGDGPMLGEGAAPSQVEDAPRETWIKGERHRGVAILARLPAGPVQSDTDLGALAETGAEGYTVVPDPRDENAFALIVEGNSMSPTLMPGDVIVVSPRRRDDVRFPVSVVRIKAEDVAVRYLDIGNDYALLSSANPEYRPIRVKLSDIEVVGRVVGWWHTVTE